MNTLSIAKSIARFGAASLALTLGLGVANASDLTVHLTRLSDTEATVTVSGVLSGPAPFVDAHMLILSDPFAVRPPAVGNSSVLEGSTMYVGGNDVNMAYDTGSQSVPGFVNAIYFGNIVLPMPEGTPFVGSIDLRLSDGAQFAAVGSTGQVSWGVDADYVGMPAGRWVVSAVPEASAAWLLVLGLAAMVLLKGSGLLNAGRVQPPLSGSPRT